MSELNSKKCNSDVTHAEFLKCTDCCCLFHPRLFLPENYIKIIVNYCCQCKQSDAPPPSVQTDLCVAGVCHRVCCHTTTPPPEGLIPKLPHFTTLQTKLQYKSKNQIIIDYRNILFERCAELYFEYIISAHIF